MKTKAITRFNGLNNTDDTVSQGLATLAKADNVHVNAAGKLVRREGRTLAYDGEPTSCYATRDGRRFFMAEAGELLVSQAFPFDFVAIGSLQSDAPLYCTEVNGDVLFTNGVDSGIVFADNQVRAWTWTPPHAVSLSANTGSLQAGRYQVCCTFLLPDGRETGAGAAVGLDLPEGSSLVIDGIPQAPGCTTAVYIAANSAEFNEALQTTQAAATWNRPVSALGQKLTTANLWPLPDGATHPVLWAGRVYVAQYFPEANQSAIWPSQPLGFHLFDLNVDPMFIAGRVTMLAADEDGPALLIGAENSTHAWDGANLTKLADYGPVDGHAWDVDDDKTVVFWTTRGACRALPFANLTERAVSVAPGSSVAAAIVRDDGGKRFIASLQMGGDAFNPLRKEPS